MDILVNVINQKLKTKANTKRLVSGTQKFIRFKFSLDDAWDGLSVFAQFIQNGKAYNDYLDENNSVYLPPEIKDGKFDVLLYGSGSNTIATTNYLTFEVDKNILISDAQSTEITESLYNKLVNIVETLPISGNADTGASVIGKESVELNGVNRTSKATGLNAVAEGIGTAARGNGCHAEGAGTIAKNPNAHAEGIASQATADASHAEGAGARAIGYVSHAEGYYTYAKNAYQHVGGKYNEYDPSTNDSIHTGTYAEIIGNGTSDTQRSNARTLDWQGNEALAGGLTLGLGTSDEITITPVQLKALLALLGTT